MHNPLERHLLNRFSDNQHGRSRAGARMRDLARSLLVPVGLLWIAVLNAGCNQIFGITPTTLAPPDAYTCGCTCNGGGRSFNLSTNVCLPEDLNAAINPSLPPDFVPTAADVQADCHTRVEQNLEQMARQCFADRIRCTCQAKADLIRSVRVLHALLRRGPRRRLQQLRSAGRPRHGHQRPRPPAGLSRERLRDGVVGRLRVGDPRAHHRVPGRRRRDPHPRR